MPSEYNYWSVGMAVVAIFIFAYVFLFLPDESPMKFHAIIMIGILFVVIVLPLILGYIILGIMEKIKKRVN